MKHGRAFWLWVLLCVCQALASLAVAAPKLPNQAPQYLPILIEELNTYHPKVQIAQFYPGLVEQESLWKLNATLKTSREWGCGFGQFTVAYNANGTVRFDALAETKRLHKSLSGWNWADCANARYQLRAVVLKGKQHERFCEVYMDTPEDVKKCMGSSYNGGEGGFTKRIRMCRAKADCNPRLWDANLEKQCAASNTKVHGYGESFCEINSRYPGRVFKRMEKYQPYMSPKP